MGPHRLLHEIKVPSPAFEHRTAGLSCELASRQWYDNQPAIHQCTLPRLLGVGVTLRAARVTRQKKPRRHDGQVLQFQHSVPLRFTLVQ
jgi:hypothetical protein